MADALSRRTFASVKGRHAKNVEADLRHLREVVGRIDPDKSLTLSLGDAERAVTAATALVRNLAALYALDEIAFIVEGATDA